MENQVNQRKILEEQLITKAFKDKVFRNQLISNPKKPFLKNMAGTFYLLLPFIQDMNAQNKLSETELQPVATDDRGFLLSDATPVPG